MSTPASLNIPDHADSTHHRSARKPKTAGGRKRSENARCERLTFTAYPSDMRDFNALATAWDVPVSTLAWGVIHEWLQRARGVSADLGEVRGQLKMCLELGLRDKELGPWLRKMIEEKPLG